MEAFLFDPAHIRDISPLVLDERGRLKVLPAELWAQTTPEERAVFGHRHACYGFPTVELVDHLQKLIDGRSAIEIGAGNGVLAQALGIPATDNRMQNRAKYRAVYAASGQPTITYGRNVIELDAAAAVRRYKPAIVIGSWVTHRYDPRRHFAGGNEIGVDETALLADVETYIAIGNDRVHEHKAIWALPHTKEYPSYVYSRAVNGTPDFIATWQGGRQRG